MKLNTLEKLYLALRDLTPAIDVPETTRQAALKPLERDAGEGPTLPNLKPKVVFILTAGFRSALSFVRRRAHPNDDDQRGRRNA